jgi:hypothetical protein
MHPGLKSALESLPRTNLTFLMTEHDASVVPTNVGSRGKRSTFN